MNLTIVQVGDPVLRQTARPLTVEEIRSEYIQTLIECMKNTMHEAPGVGLAAPQIGLSLQLAVIEDKPEYCASLSPEQAKERGRYPVPFHVIINPKLTLIGEQKLEHFEGCLSLAGFIGIVARAPEVKVECLNEQGLPITIEAQGWYARILQHEIGHLQGKLYFDHCLHRSLTNIENFINFWGNKSVAEIKKELGI